MFRAAFVLAAFCAVAGQTPAADGAEKLPREKVFELLDRDKSGSLSPEEFVQGTVGRAAKSKRKEFVVWDLDGNGAIDFTEFRKRGKQKPDPKARAAYFKTLDRDHDGNLTLEEYLWERSQEDAIRARIVFFAHDFDEDDHVTLQELLRSTQDEQDVTVSSRNQFKQRDSNGDGVLSEEEFLRPSVGKSYEDAARRNFAKFDLDKDECLGMAEFGILPTQNPDAGTLFRGLDRNRDERITLDEYLALHPAAKRERGRFDFYARDRDEDGTLDLQEYTSEEGEEPVSSVNQFKQRDSDGDGKLTSGEFASPNAKTKFYEIAQSNFRVYDADGDGFLSLGEFQLTPEQHPTTDTLFEGLDDDDNGHLTRQESVRFTPAGQLGLARRLFKERDGNNDGSLDQSEYRAYTKAMSWARWKHRFWTECRQWVFWIVIVLDIALVTYIVHCVTVIRRANRRVRVRPRSDVTGFGSFLTGVAPTPNLAGSDTPLSTPESLDEFQVE